MLGPQLGPVLYMSPTDDMVGWLCLGIGLLVGSFVRGPDMSMQKLAGGAALVATARDFQIPLDALLLAALPICVVAWRNDVYTQTLLMAAVVVNYFVAKDIDPPRSSWFPGVAAAFYMSVPSKYKILRVAIILARHLVPRAVHVLYGLCMFTQFYVYLEYWDNVSGPALFIVLNTLIAREWWFVYFYAVIAIGIILYKYIVTAVSTQTK